VLVDVGASVVVLVCGIVCVEVEEEEVGH
jgi:hypothetical protein